MMFTKSLHQKMVGNHQTSLDKGLALGHQDEQKCLGIYVLGGWDPRMKYAQLPTMVKKIVRHW